jgi:membrane fusion protein, multidrug efflux system
MKVTTYRGSMLYLALLIVLNACQPKPESETNTLISQTLPDQERIKVIVLEKTTFQKQLQSSGKLFASQKTKLFFTNPGHIHEVNYLNGQRVSEGAVIAVSDTHEASLTLGKTALALEQSRLELQNVLIGMGYSLDDSLKVPYDKMKLAALKSGYEQSLFEHETARLKLEQCSLRAPFSGIIADIKTQPFDTPAGERFCTLINDATFDASFRMMEAELKMIGLNNSVRIIPFACNDTLTGTIVSINPVVDEQGMVEVKAKVQNNGCLMEGMNVKVIIEQALPNQFVVPKSAVLIRQNQEVLFRLVDGKAFWTYVITTDENSVSYAVIPHPEKSGAMLQTGDSIIISGNLNLAHESAITVY